MPRQTVQRRHQNAEVRLYRQLCAEIGRQYVISDNPNVAQRARRFMAALRPMAVVGREKVRIGGAGDGGYVSLPPGENGIAYSFGVSTCSPWDLAMAERNFSVYQYDGSIPEEPDKHPNIFFNRYFVGTEPSDALPTKTLGQIIRENNHEHERDIILQMDIEEAEWAIFQEMGLDDQLRFSQIIIEFHNLAFDENRLSILKKLCRTHTPVHIHYNNSTLPILILPDNYFYCPTFEMTLVRSAEHTFHPDDAYYPTPLDFPNRDDLPDIPVGYFDLLLDPSIQTITNAGEQPA